MKNHHLSTFSQFLLKHTQAEEEVFAWVENKHGLIVFLGVPHVYQNEMRENNEGNSSSNSSDISNISNISNISDNRHDFLLFAGSFVNSEAVFYSFEQTKFYEGRVSLDMYDKVLPYLKKFNSSEEEKKAGSNQNKSDAEQNSKEIFYEEFSYVKSKISQGLIKKAVPYYFFENNTDVDFDSYFSVSFRERELYRYGMLNQNGEGVVGITPEIICETKADFPAQIYSLAGTKQNGEFFGDKEIEEQDFVSLGIIEDLKRDDWAVSLAEQDQISFGPIKHIRSKFHAIKKRVTSVHGHGHGHGQVVGGQSGEAEFARLVHSLHPTAAIGVYPKNNATMNILTSMEEMHPHAFYASPIGVFNKKKQEGICFVSLRQIIKSSQHKKYIPAGCGVTGQSDFESEWQEILNKKNAVERMLGHEL